MPPSQTVLSKDRGNIYSILTSPCHQLHKAVLLGPVSCPWFCSPTLKLIPVKGFLSLVFPYLENFFLFSDLGSLEPFPILLTS